MPNVLCLSQPTRQFRLPLYNLAFFLWMQSWVYSQSFPETHLFESCLENSLNQCSLPSPKLRGCGPLSPGCMHSICIQIIYSETEIANPSLGWRNIYLVTHTLLSWGTETGLLTAVLPHTSFGAVYCRPFYPKAMGSSLRGRIGNQLMDRKYLLRHINSLPCQAASL